MKHIISYVLALVAVTLTAANASAQDYDFTTDDGLYLKITATSTDTIEVSLVGIKLSQEYADMTVNRVITYRNNPVIISEINLTYKTDSFIGNILSIEPQIAVRSLKEAPFVKYNLPKGIDLEPFFSGNRYVESITLPEDTKIIPPSSFKDCSSLKAISIPRSVTEIGAKAFANCSGLETIEDLSGVTKVGEDAFWGCVLLSKLMFSDNLSEIGAGAFGLCRDLEYVNIGKTTTIEKNTFRYTGLTSLEFLEGVKILGERALCDLNKLEKAILPNSLETYTPPLISGKNITYIKFGNKIKSVAPYSCWSDLPNLNTIDLNQVEYLAQSAISAPLLYSITLPPSVKCAFTTSFYSAYNVTVEDSTEPLDFTRGNGFKGFSGKIYLGRSLAGEGYFWTITPFGACKSVTFGDLVEHLPGNTFREASIPDLKLPKNIRYIGQKCFGSIGNEVLVLPAALDTLCERAFIEAPNLIDVVCYAETPPVCDSTAFPDIVYAFARLEVPDVDAYRSAPGWKNFRNIVTSGIDDPLADPSAPVISVEEGAIKVSGTGPAEIYSADGRLIYRGSPAAIPALPRGLYIVRAGTTSLKLTL